MPRWRAFQHWRQAVMAMSAVSRLKRIQTATGWKEEGGRLLRMEETHANGRPSSAHVGSPATRSLIPSPGGWRPPASTGRGGMNHAPVGSGAKVSQSVSGSVRRSASRMNHAPVGSGARPHSPHLTHSRSLTRVHSLASLTHSRSLTHSLAHSRSLTHFLAGSEPRCVCMRLCMCMHMHMHVCSSLAVGRDAPGQGPGGGGAAGSRERQGVAGASQRASPHPRALDLTLTLTST